MRGIKCVAASLCVITMLFCSCAGNTNVDNSMDSLSSSPGAGTQTLSAVSEADVLSSSEQSASDTKEEQNMQKYTDPEIWMGPNGASMFQILDLSEEEAAQTLKKISGYNIFIDIINQSTPQQREELAALLKKYSVKVSIECGGNLNHEWGDHCGEDSAAIELSKMLKWKNAGGTVDMLFVDGPIRRVTTRYGDGWGSEQNAPYLTVEQAAHEFADYIQAVKEYFPNVKIFWGVNFPNWGWKGDIAYFALGPNNQFWGDFSTVFPTVLRVLDERNVTIDGIQVDNPYDYYIGHQPGAGVNVDPARIDWAKRVNELEDMVRGKGLQFHLVTNSSSGERSSEEFQQDVLAYVDLYRCNGGEADAYFVESWYKYPDVVSPEDSPYTMANTVLKVLEAVHGPN